MKIYEEVVIDIESGKVLSERSFEYSGEIARLGGGGGSTGNVELPAHITAAHKDMLNRSVVGISSGNSWVELFNNIASAASPYSGEVSADPDSFLSDMDTSLSSLEALVDGLASSGTFDDYAANILDDTFIENEIEAYSDILTEDIENKTVPRFEAGMRDINAVNSSAFVLGKALIYTERDRQIAKFSADMFLKVKHEDALRVIITRLQYQEMLTRLSIEKSRYGIIAKSEESERTLEYKYKDSVFDISLIQGGSNLLAGPSGGVVYDNKGPNKTQTAMGGALTGAAAGAQVGGPYGAVIGGVVGLAAGYLAGE